MTDPVSAESVEITRKNAARIQGEILRRLAEVTQEHAADCMGVHASTVSRQKEGLEGFCQLLSALGFQLSRSDSVVVSQGELQALELMTFKYLQSKVSARVL